MRQLLVPLLVVMAALTTVFILAFALLTSEHEAATCVEVILAAGRCESEPFPCRWRPDDPRLDDLEYVCVGDGSGGLPRAVD